MMMKRFLCILLALGCSLMASAQSNKLIKELEGRRGELQKQIQESESLLQSTKKDVKGQMNSLATLTSQIEERKRYIQTINGDVERIDAELTSLEKQLRRLEGELRDKKQKYEASVQYLYKNRSIQEKWMFIFSAENLAQTYRRIRYVQEYATYQRLQGEDIMAKQEQVRKKKSELQQVRKAKENLLAEREAERAKLEKQEAEKKKLVDGLKRKQKGIQNELAKKRREANQLNARIDKLIAEEIERARRQAAEEARREAAARKKAEAAKKGNATAGGNKSASTSPTTKIERYDMTKADQKLSSDFVTNKGRLPMPVTGPYLITSHYGQYNVEGLRNVKLDNKGINIQAKPGSQARAIFNGKVTAVFKYNGLFNILVRHGNYISVYCNLSSAEVKQGQEVTTKQVLGTIFSDKADGNRTTLHFQLRKEKEKLNPEPWLNR